MVDIASPVFGQTVTFTAVTQPLAAGVSVTVRRRRLPRRHRGHRSPVQLVNGATSNDATVGPFDHCLLPGGGGYRAALGSAASHRQQRRSTTATLTSSLAARRRPADQLHHRGRGYCPARACPGSITFADGLATLTARWSTWRHLTFRRSAGPHVRRHLQRRQQLLTSKARSASDPPTRC